MHDADELNSISKYVYAICTCFINPLFETILILGYRQLLILLSGETPRPGSEFVF